MLSFVILKCSKTLSISDINSDLNTNTVSTELESLIQFEGDGQKMEF